MAKWISLPLVSALALMGGCSDDPSDPSNPPSSSSASASSASSSTSGAGGLGGGGGMGGAGGAWPDPSGICAELSIPAQPFSRGPHGALRGEVAADFAVDLVDGTTWVLQDRFSGCEMYAFVPDTLGVSDLDDTSVWESDKDLVRLIEKSPKNVHYFFVSRKTAEGETLKSTQDMQARIAALMATMPPAEAEHWTARLHVVAHTAKDLGGWLAEALGGHGRLGFVIDRGQRIRGVGLLADVTRYSQVLADAMVWPFKSNLAYVAHDMEYLNAQADQQARLDAEDVEIVTLWDGAILEAFADVEVSLPGAAEMADFDTLEVEVTMQCPDAEAFEFGNCGAWDYLAKLFVEDGPDTFVELARFITSYHRETHWVADVSPMLAQIKEGGVRKFRWSFAPEWNKQPTATSLSLRFSNRSKGLKASQATYLASGGTFNAAYNASRTPTDVSIPQGAKKVELWAIITGHGSDAKNQCAEFCNHQHEFTVNGSAHVTEHPEAGSDQGCMAQIDQGMVPNQGGTWWFGRGGWCPGQQVKPVVVDVTAEVTPGETATVGYRGMFKGADPPDVQETESPPNIELASYLVVYE